MPRARKSGELQELFETYRAVPKVVGDFVLELSDGGFDVSGAIVTC